jgi:hypothetical protein
MHWLPFCGFVVLRRFSSPRTKLLAARCECLHLIKINGLALWLDESAHASLAASCEELRAKTGNPPLVDLNSMMDPDLSQIMFKYPLIDKPPQANK